MDNHYVMWENRSTKCEHENGFTVSWVRIWENEDEMHIPGTLYYGHCSGESGRNFFQKYILRKVSQSVRVEAKAIVNIYCPQNSDLGTETVSWIMSNCTNKFAGTIQSFVPTTIVRHFCPITFRPCNNPMLAKYCHAFQELVVSNAGISYRNAACAQCDGLIPEERLECNPYRNIQFTPKSPGYPQWKFDFRGFYIDSVALKTPCQLGNKSRPYFRYVCEDKYNPSENRSSQYYTSLSFDEFGAQLVIPQHGSVPNLIILASTFR